MSNGGITLALGGGGARGLAHLGVIEVLEDAGITIDRVVGVSMGSISGSLYAYQRDVRDAQEKVCAYVQLPVFQRHQEALFGARRGSDPNGGLAWVGRIKEYLRANRLFHRAIFSRSLLPDKVLRHSIDTLLPDIDILDTACPLSIVTIDLLAGHRRVIEAGSLRDAVQGSSSLPAVFAPVPFEGALLCDIGAVDPVPTAVARELSSGPVISSDVGPGLATIQSCETVIEVVLRVEEVAGSLFRDHAAATSDVTIRPAVQHVEWLDFTCVPDVIEAGRRAAREAMPHVRAVVERAANAPLSRPRPGTANKRPHPVRDHDTLRRAGRPGDVSSDQCYGDDVSDAARGYPDSPETTP